MQRHPPENGCTYNLQLGSPCLFKIKQMALVKRLLPCCYLRYLLCLLLTLLVSVSGSGCASDNPSALAFPPFDADFSRYRHTLHGWLQERSMSHRSDDDIELNLPFELNANASVPYRGRYLLFHGLNDSPYVWHDIVSKPNRFRSRFFYGAAAARLIS